MSLPVSKLLAELSARGVTIRADGETLRIRPASACKDLLQDVRERKPELLALLSLPLADRVLKILARDGRHTTLSLALALGRPRDLELYVALGALLKDRSIATDPATCTYFRREA